MSRLEKGLLVVWVFFGVSFLVTGNPGHGLAFLIAALLFVLV